MAAPRLPFLWPTLARGVEISNPNVRAARAAARFQAYHSSSQRRAPNTIPQQPRYGPANEPPPHLGGGKAIPSANAQQTSGSTKALPKIGEKLQKDGEAEVKAEQQDAQGQAAKRERSANKSAVGKRPRSDPMLDGAEAKPPTTAPPGSLDTPPEHPMESLLEVVPEPQQHADEQQQQSSSKPPPEDEHPERAFDEHAPPVKPPHIDTPRHVHHFDTFGLVKRLVESGWSEQQAITIMKGMRVLLADNIDVAREALVSKSQVENETYLFRAACAELKTEVTSRRKAEQEKMRTERNQLQHEVDILNQKVNQESAALKDELKGMFDDRKMAVRNEQRAMESKVQRLNYQITVELQADAKSEVESLRWVMTRRVMIALGTVVVMVIGSLKLYSNAAHEADLDAKRKANMKSGGTQTDGSNNGQNGGDIGASPRDPRLPGAEMLVRDGDNPAFVSLG